MRDNSARVSTERIAAQAIVYWNATIVPLDTMVSRPWKSSKLQHRHRLVQILKFSDQSVARSHGTAPQVGRVKAAPVSS